MRPLLYPVIDGFKTCSKCMVSKAVTDFMHDSRYKRPRSACRDCVLALNRADRERAKSDGRYEDRLKKKAEYRRATKASRLERVSVGIKAGMMFCHVLQGRSWSKAFKKPKAKWKGCNPKRIEKVRDGLNAGETFCAVMRRREWSKAFRPEIGSHQWLRSATDEEVNAYWDRQGKPWNKRGLSAIARYRARYSNDIGFCLKERMRLRIRSALVRHIGSRNLADGRNLPSYGLPYTTQELRDHLEVLFADGMTWAEFSAGKIHIDHIKPCVLFDMNNEEDFNECWSLSNLQPLWAWDNLRKNSEWEGVMVKRAG